MRTTRLITVPLAAALTTAALAGPAVAQAGDTHSQPYGGHAVTSTTLPGPPTWPANPQPIPRPSADATTPDSGFDWLSAGIGVAAAGLFAIALVGIASLRRRVARPRSLTTQ